MARPPKAPAERRDDRLPAPRMTAAELAFVETQAAAAGIGMAEFVRRRVLVSGGVNPRINGASSSRDQHDTRPCYRQGRRHRPLVAQCAWTADPL